MKISAQKLIEETLDTKFLGGTAPPLKVNVAFGPTKSKLILAIGENASGKSFYRRIVQSVCSIRLNIECIHISVEGRAAGGIVRAFVYGDESRDSTGKNSVNTIHGAFTTSKGRDKDHVIIWDEPDLGLSEGASWGAGKEIAAFLSDAPTHLRACVIITHSRYLLREIGQVPHHFISFEEGFGSVDEWLEREISPVSLQDIRDRNLKTYRKILKVMKD